MERLELEVCGQDPGAASGRGPAPPLRAAVEDLLPCVKYFRWRALRFPYNHSAAGVAFSH
jgi:hypothetical protein